MKNLSILCSLLLFLSFGCQKTSSQTWENVKTATRYLNKGLDSLMGKEMDSKMITAEDDFFGPDHDEFIPLSDEDLNTKFSIAEAPMIQKDES